MGGRPLDQARAVLMALIESLDERDQLEMIEFSSSPRRWKSGPTRVTSGARKDALGWVKKLSASGGTEMRSALLEAFAPLRAGAQRQVVLMTDGLIGFEDEILAAVQDRMPPSSRLHCVGVGAGVNRSLSRPASRAGRGVELIVDLDEDAAPAARRIVARTAAPLVTDLRIEGAALVDTAPARLPDLFAGTPALISLRLDPRGGAITVRGTTAEGEWSTRVEVPACAEGSGPDHLGALYAREQVEDLEARWALGRDRSVVDAQIEELGLGYQIGTRLTSWVAITSEITVDRPLGGLRQDMPQELPYGSSIEGLGLRAAADALAALPVDPSVATGSFPIAPGSPRRLSMMGTGSKSMAKGKVSSSSSNGPLAAPLGVAMPSVSAPRPGGAPPMPMGSAYPASAPGGMPSEIREPLAMPSAMVHGLPVRSSQGRSWGWILLLLVLILAPLLAWWWLHRAHPSAASPAPIPAHSLAAPGAREMQRA
jgi:Ca-activated chloride channel family protein